MSWDRNSYTEQYHLFDNSLKKVFKTSLQSSHLFFLFHEAGKRWWRSVVWLTELILYWVYWLTGVRFTLGTNTGRGRKQYKDMTRFQLVWWSHCQTIYGHKNFNLKFNWLTLETNTGRERKQYMDIKKETTSGVVHNVRVLFSGMLSHLHSQWAKQDWGTKLVTGWPD